MRRIVRIVKIEKNEEELTYGWSCGLIAPTAKAPTMNAIGQLSGNSVAKWTGLCNWPCWDIPALKEEERKIVRDCWSMVSDQQGEGVFWP